MDYTVYFENLPAATAAAQEVFITDQLDGNLDWSTLDFQEIAFGDEIIPISSDDYEFTDDATIEDFRGNGLVWRVNINGRLDVTTGELLWKLHTLDPETGMLPDDPFAGFLPPEDGTGRGQGHVRFTIRVKADVPDETRIANEASIVFDTNEPIETNQVWNAIGVPEATDRRLYFPIVLNQTQTE